ncbi:VOC family protein [Endozoicomonas numazuensis]|uniref:VOC family protein n=1 Tax=Endozoicomonas numazuensis TaxID=1137799 RepID=UPI000A44077B|nr:VOC family protein [Endozoicomonas numazuensis]
MKLTHHRLMVSDLDQSLSFYCQKLGMNLESRRLESDSEHCFLAYPHTQGALLELVYCQGVKPEVAPQPSRTEGYWKFSISVVDLQKARQHLIDSGVSSVGDCFEVPDVAFLCHLQDPDGYCIELIQQTFKKNTPALLNDIKTSVWHSACLNLSTLRSRDIGASLSFYEQIGLRLVSRQSVADRNMTLYFLTGDEEKAPLEDIDAIEIREWLWQRPYTLLELQHIHGTETQEGFHYRTGIETGFLGLTLVSNEYEKGKILNDPDGYIVKILSSDS